MFRSGLEARWRGQNYFWRSHSIYLALLCAEHNFSCIADTQKHLLSQNDCLTSVQTQQGLGLGDMTIFNKAHTLERTVLNRKMMVKRGKEEDVASVPHRSFDETTTNCADSQCKVMQTRWGPERLQERQGCLGKIIWGYHIIHLYFHSSLEWTLYLGSRLVSHWCIASWDALG